MKEPWSKQHKRVFQGSKYSLSNSFAQPLNMKELLEITNQRQDTQLIEEYFHHTLEYTPNGGSLDLRKEIANLYGEHITADHVLVCTGGQVAIQIAALAMAATSDDCPCHSITFTPGYQSTVESPEWANCSSPSSSSCKGRVTKIPRKASEDWQIDLQALREAIIPGQTKYLVLNEPYNPAGIVMSSQRQQELIDICREQNIVVLCDEVYRLLEHDPQTTRIPAMADVYSKGISAVTMSKPWGACGITIGWLVCQDLEIKQRLVDVQYFGTACPSRASELQAIMVLRASDTILEERRTILLRNLKLLKTFVHDYGEFFSWREPNAGAIAFLKFLGPLTSQELGEQMLTERGISIKPTYCFAEEVTPEIESYFRVGFGERKMPHALDALIAFVEDHKDEWRRQMKETIL